MALYPLVAGRFVAASLLGGVLGGDWADRGGAQRPLAAGVALTVSTLLISATSTSLWPLAAGRFLNGLAAGMIAVSINTAIAQDYPYHLRPRAWPATAPPSGCCSCRASWPPARARNA